MIRSLAVIGLGAMGAPMARRLHGAGFPLSVYDRNASALHAFAELGAHIANSPAECAKADLILLIVASKGQVREVLLGPQGIVAGLQAPQAPTVAVMSTMPAQDIQTLALELVPTGITLIDAPISGGVIRAEQGTLTLLTAGDADKVSELAPVFACLGTHHFHCGALGSAQTMKIVNNILGIASAVIAAEAYHLALDKGLDLTYVAQVLEVSTGRNFSSQAPGPQATFAAMTRDRPAFDALTAILRKDLASATELADATGHAYPVIHGIKQIIDGMGDEAYGHWRRVADLS